MNSGFQNIFTKTEGAHFGFWHVADALQYLDGKEKSHYESWFHDIHFEELMKLDNQFQVNLNKPNSGFQAAFILAKLNNDQ